MGKEFEWMFFQIRHTNDQLVHEKALNITNHQGNVSQKHNKSISHLLRSSHQIGKKNKCW